MDHQSQKGVQANDNAQSSVQQENRQGRNTQAIRKVQKDSSSEAFITPMYGYRVRTCPWSRQECPVIDGD